MKAIPVKICGLTRREDARLAWELGAAALGFVFHAASPRVVDAATVASIRRGLPKEAFCVGVFVDRPAEEVNALAEAAGLDAVQLHGREAPALCAAVRHPVIKAIRAEDEAELDAYEVAAYLLDAHLPGASGGTGLQADWELAARLATRVPLVLAGGLGAENAREAAAKVRPWALDLCSGVEAAPGIKDVDKLARLLAGFPWKGERPCLLP